MVDGWWLVVVLVMVMVVNEKLFSRGLCHLRRVRVHILYSNGEHSNGHLLRRVHCLVLGPKHQSKNGNNALKDPLFPRRSSLEGPWNETRFP